MAYDKDVFDAAMRRLEQRRQEAEAETARSRAELFAHIPRLREIQDELAATAVDAVRSMLTGGDTAANMQELKKINLGLQAERAELLTAHGLEPDVLAPRTHCRLCGDTGYVGDRICECLRALLRDEACKRANSGSPLPLRTFDTFDLTYYPDVPLSGQSSTVRAYMGRVFASCKEYAERFSAESPSLLFLGGTGLGKTHLALAIAGEVLAHGFSVIYDTAQNIFDKIEAEHFGRGNGQFIQTAYDCDLLILDELPDYATSFTSSTFYNIINTRTLTHRPVIVSTNLTEKELEARYGQKIFSRLIGEFWMFRFFGRDIRQLKLKNKVF